MILFPNLNQTIRQLVVSGIYSIFETSDIDYPFILFTNKRKIHSLNENGDVSSFMNKTIEDFKIKKRIILDMSGDLETFVNKKNN